MLLEMTEHPTQRELDDYCRRVLAPSDFLSVHRHVTTCPRCAAQCDTPGHLARDLAHLRDAFVTAPDETPYHLSAIEMTRYSEGKLGEIDLEIAESHLETCDACRHEVRQARQVREVRQPPAPARVSFPPTTRWQPMRIAAAVLLGVALVLLVLWLLRSRTAKPEQIAWPPAASPSPVSVASSPTPELSPVPQATFALELNDGSRKVTLDQKGTLAGLDRLPARIQERVGAALKTGRVEQPPVLAQLAGQRSTLLGDSGNGLPFRLVGPLGQIVRPQQPTFRWRALEGAQSYKVVVTDADLNQVAASPSLTATEWRVDKPLPPGGIYSWQVTASKDGTEIISPVLPAPQAKFKVLDSSTARMLQQAERAYADSHLTLGVLYAEAGLLDEAEQELRALSRDNPRSDVAQKLLRSLSGRARTQ